MEHVELVATFGGHFQELKSPPIAALQEHRPVLVLIPGANLLAEILRGPDPDRKNPWPRIRAGAAACEEQSQTLFGDGFRSPTSFAKNEASLVVVAHETLGCAPRMRGDSFDL